MDRALLRKWTAAYMSELSTVYGVDEMLPKFHELMRMSLYTWERLPNCIVHERRHKYIKQFANGMKNAKCSWDGGILEEATSLDIIRSATTDPTRYSVTAGPVDGRMPSRRVRTALVAVLGCFSRGNLRTAPAARANRYGYVKVGNVVMVGQDDTPIMSEIRYLVSVSDDGLAEVMTGINEYTIVTGRVTYRRCWKCVET